LFFFSFFFVVVVVVFFLDSCEFPEEAAQGMLWRLRFRGKRENAYASAMTSFTVYGVFAEEGRPGAAINPLL
jgi:hypothetical protein